MATERNPIDEDVERAFDLLQHYKGLLSSLNPGAADLQNALNGIEDVMRTWLPRAASANDPLLKAVSAKLGDREAARNLFAHSDLWEARLQCLQRLADASIPATLSTRELLEECRARLQHWRKLLPTIFRMGNGQRHLQTGAREAAQLVGRYWSTGIEDRPSIRGASLFLAASCHALARAAHHAGRAFEAPLRLAQRLREHPNWVQVEPLDVIAVLDEQLAAVRGVEELIAELDIVAGGEDSNRAGVIRLHKVVESIAGHLSNIVQFVARYPSPAQGLMWLDQHALVGSEQAHGDEQQAAWRTTVVGLRKAVEEARDLWGDDRTTTGAHAAYVRTSRGGVKCGPIERATCHELVIAVGRLMLDPLDPGAIWENELGAVDLHIGTPDDVRRHARVLVTRALGSRPWWQALTIGMQREFAEVVADGRNGSGPDRFVPPVPPSEAGTSELAAQGQTIPA